MGDLQNPGERPVVQLKKRVANGFPINVIYKYLCTHYHCIVWPHDSVFSSVEVKHVSDFPFRSPCSLPQIQPITPNLQKPKVDD